MLVLINELMAPAFIMPVITKKAERIFHTL